MSWQVDPQYLVIILLESAISLAAIAAGRGLKNRRRWAGPSAVMVWGGLLGPSLLLGSLILRQYLGLEYDLWDAVTILPRLVYYLATIAAAPYGLWWMLQRPLIERPATWVVWGCFVVGLGAGCAGIALVIHE